MLCYFLFINTFVTIACCWCYCIWIFHKWISISFFSIYTILLFFCVFVWHILYFIIIINVVPNGSKNAVTKKMLILMTWNNSNVFFFTFKSFINYREINKMSIWLDSFIHYMKRKKKCKWWKQKDQRSWSDLFSIVVVVVFGSIRFVLNILAYIIIEQNRRKKTRQNYHIINFDHHQKTMCSSSTKIDIQIMVPNGYLFGRFIWRSRSEKSSSSFFFCSKIILPNNRESFFLSCSWLKIQSIKMINYYDYGYYHC